MNDYDNYTFLKTSFTLLFILMTQIDKHDPNSRGYTNALLEDINGKFQAVLEATEPIPRLQTDVAGISEQINIMEPKLDAVFEEVGSLRQDVEVIKEAMKLLGRHDKHLENIDQRLSAVEQRVR